MEVQPHLLNLSAYINQNLEKDLPLSSLAKRVGLSPFHFHRKFGAYFGESLHQHIKRLRLERAAYSLLYGSKPVREIARESGYKTVSAFSHAFSGFAGQSPTRYRSRVPGDAEADANDRAAPASVNGAGSVGIEEPAWVGDLPPQGFAFVRARGNGHGVQGSIREAMQTALKLARPTDGVDPAPMRFIAATTDVYGVVNGREFRIDVGLDADSVAPDRMTALGAQVLPGGRYARFDFTGKPDELLARSIQASLHGLQALDEVPRPTAHFVRFEGTSIDAGNGNGPDPGDAAERSYQLFIPVA